MIPMTLKQKGIRLSSPFSNFRLLETPDYANDVTPGQQTSDDKDGGVDNVDDSQGGYGGPRDKE